VGVPTNLLEAARTYQELESSYKLSGPGLFDFQIGKIDLSAPGTNDSAEARNRLKLIKWKPEPD